MQLVSCPLHVSLVGGIAANVIKNSMDQKIYWLALTSKNWLPEKGTRIGTRTGTRTGLFQVDFLNNATIIKILIVHVLQVFENNEFRGSTTTVRLSQT